MITEIKFKGETASKGRNGIIKTSGIEVMSSSYGVMISPITSKGKPSDACFIEIWETDIQEAVITMLSVTGIDIVEFAKKTLVGNGYVDFFVSSEEIRAVATDMQRELSDEEVASVVDFLSHNDLEIGLCEEAISGAISELCPDATDQEWDDDSDPDEACERDRERHGTDGYENDYDYADCFEPNDIGDKE